LSEKDKSLSEISLSEISTEKIDETDEKFVKEALKNEKFQNLAKRKTIVKINKKGFQRKWLKEFSWLRYDSKEKKCTVNYVGFMVLIFLSLKKV
jgi:hypothetical protein